MANPDLEELELRVLDVLGVGLEVEEDFLKDVFLEEYRQDLDLGSDVEHVSEEVDELEDGLLGDVLREGREKSLGEAALLEDLGKASGVLGEHHWFEERFEEVDDCQTQARGGGVEEAVADPIEHDTSIVLSSLTAVLLKKGGVCLGDVLKEVNHFSAYFLFTLSHFSVRHLKWIHLKSLLLHLELISDFLMG
jgi:hypothetical protein